MASPVLGIATTMSLGINASRQLWPNLANLPTRPCCVPTDGQSLSAYQLGRDTTISLTSTARLDFAGTNDSIPRCMSYSRTR